MEPHKQIRAIADAYLKMKMNEQAPQGGHLHGSELYFSDIQPPLPGSTIAKRIDAEKKKQELKSKITRSNVARTGIMQEESKNQD